MAKHDKRMMMIIDELRGQGLTATGRTPSPLPQPQNFQPPVYIQAPPPPQPSTYRSTSARVMVNGDAAVAEVSYQVPPDPAEIKKFNRLPADAQVQKQAHFYGAYPSPKTFTGTGASKRERGDSHDPVTGEILAAARAFDELAARLFREARGRIRAQDSERDQQSRRRTKEEWEQMMQRASTPASDLDLDLDLDIEKLPDASVEFTGTFDKADPEPIDATVVVRKSLTDVAEHLQRIIDVLR